MNLLPNSSSFNWHINNSGQTIKQVQEFLGHEKAAAALDVYAQLDMEGKWDTANAMDSLLARKSC